LVKEKEIQTFLNPLPILEIPGIGPKTAELLYIEGIQTIKDLSRLSIEKLKELLGNKHGEDIYYKVRGIDNDPITEFREAKSIGEQTTFQKNTLDATFIVPACRQAGDNVFKRFTETNFTKFQTSQLQFALQILKPKPAQKALKKLSQKLIRKNSS